MNWLPWIWLAVLPLAICALLIGARGDEVSPEKRFSCRRIHPLRVLPSLGLLAVSIAIAAVAALERPQDPDYSLWLVATILAILSIVASVWFSVWPWW